jgi:sugar/nucleoside kinase (ribokinase family)
MRIGSLGMATLDTLLFTREAAFQDKAVTAVEEAVVTPGGKGIVAAAAMQRAGAEVLPFSLMGRESELAELLPEEISSRFQLPLLDADSRTWITVSEAQEVVTFVSRGRLEGDARGAAAAVHDFVAEVDALYLTLEHPTILRAALDEASRRRIPIALNTTLPLINTLLEEDDDLLVQLVASSEVILCNEIEEPLLLQALNVGTWRQVQAPPLREVVITTGAAGGRFGPAPFDQWDHFPATPVKEPLCVVGAGDTFNGAYLVARWVGGASPSESCRRGAALAALKVAHKGSMLPIDRSTTR